MPSIPGPAKARDIATFRFCGNDNAASRAVPSKSVISQLILSGERPLAISSFVHAATGFREQYRMRRFDECDTARI